MEGGDINQEEEGGQRGALGGSYRDGGWAIGGALGDKSALPPREEGGDPFDHIGGYVFGEEKGPQFCRIDIVEADLYIREKSGHLQEGSLEGPNLLGEGGDCIRGAESRKGATLVGVEQTKLLSVFFFFYIMRSLFLGTRSFM